MRERAAGRRAAALLSVLLAAPLAALPLSAAEEAPPPAEASAREGSEPAATKTKPAPAGEPSAVEVDEASATVTEALQGKEGVRIQTMCTHCNSANIQVGGLAQDLVPLMRGGYPIFGGLATSFVMSFLPSDTIADAKVLRGPRASALPASAAGGAILLSDAKPRELPIVDVIGSIGSFSRRGATVRVAGPMASWVSGSLVLGRELVSPVGAYADRGVHDVAGVTRSIADGSLAFTPARNHTIDLGASWISEDDLEGKGAFDVVASYPFLFSGSADGDPHWTREDTKLDRNEFRGGWEWRLKGGASIDLRYLRAARDQTVRSQETAVAVPGSDLSVFFDRLEIRERQDWGALRYRQPIGFKWRIEAGLEGVYERVTATRTDPTTKRSEAPVTDYVKTWSGFADASWTPTQKWDLQGGIRYDADELFDSAVSPRVTVAFRPATGWTLRLLAGRTFRPPKPIFAEVCCGQAYQRNINVRSETAWTYGFEGLYQPSPDWRLSLYVARTDFDDYIVRLVGWSLLYRQTYALANVPSARSETAEVAARWSPAGWLTLDGSLGWLSFFNRGGRGVEIQIFPPSSSSLTSVIKPIDRIPYRPLRTGSISARFTLPRGVVLSTQGNYTGPQLIQQFAPPPITSAANGLLDDMRQVQSFWMVNVSLQAPLHRMLDLVAGVDNLTDTIQHDLQDPTRDYNWGPLAGRSFRFDLRFHLDR